MGDIRQTYKPLTEIETKDLWHMKDLASDLMYFLEHTPEGTPEITIAKRKLQECVFWATHSMTR